MVQPAEHWHRDGLVRLRAELPRCRNRDALTEALVGARRIEILESELAENAAQVTLSENDPMIETLAGCSV